MSAALEAAGALPESFDAWFARCVVRDPNQRFQTALRPSRTHRLLGAAFRSGGSQLRRAAAATARAHARRAATAGRALVITADGIRRYLSWFGEPSEPPTLAPACDPPFFQSVAIRRRLGEPVQAELFDAQ